MKGETAETIAFTEDCALSIVAALIREAAADARENMQSGIEEALLRQTLGLQHLIFRCMETIERQAKRDPPVFDREAIKCLIMVYDRQAKLLGMDKGKPQGDTGNEYRWMRTAGDDDLRARAKLLGIRLPEPIFADA